MGKQTSIRKKWPVFGDMGEKKKKRKRKNVYYIHKLKLSIKYFNLK